jgi:formyltetrahydrofolate hydrolase
MKDSIELLIAICSLMGIVWKIAKIEEKVNDRIQSVENLVEVHLREYQIRREWVDYMLHATNEALKHKFERLREEIKLMRES